MKECEESESEDSPIETEYQVWLERQLANKYHQEEKPITRTQKGPKTKQIGLDSIVQSQESGAGVRGLMMCGFLQARGCPSNISKSTRAGTICSTRTKEQISR